MYASSASESRRCTRVEKEEITAKGCGLTHVDSRDANSFDMHLLIPFVYAHWASRCIVYFEYFDIVDFASQYQDQFKSIAYLPGDDLP